MRNTERGPIRNQRGVAFLTVMLLLLILTVLGVAAVTVSGLENRIAGLARTSEAAASAAESCLGTAANIIRQTIDQGSLPTTFLSSATPPGPVPHTNSTVLNQEILGQLDNNADVADGAGAVPNIVQTVGAYTVAGDIDRLYVKAKAGSGIQMFGAYEGTAGGASAGGADILYRVDCVASNIATGASSRVTAIYACTVTGESCQRQLQEGRP